MTGSWSLRATRNEHQRVCRKLKCYELRVGVGPHVDVGSGPAWTAFAPACLLRVPIATRQRRGSEAASGTAVCAAHLLAAATAAGQAPAPPRPAPRG